MRVYLKLPYGVKDKVFIDKNDINEAIKKESFCKHKKPSYSDMMAGRGQYLICGPDGTEDMGYELLISQDQISKVRWVDSEKIQFYFDFAPIKLTP